MIILLIMATIGLFVLYFLYEEHRKKIRIPIVVLIALLGLIYLSPTVKCAFSLSWRSISSLSWKVISFQHEMCVFGNTTLRTFGG